MINNSVNINSYQNLDTKPISYNNVSNIANSVPITDSYVRSISESHRQQNNLHHNYRKQLYSVYGAPSSGSTTESFLKSKSLNSPVYRHNEMSTKYNMISSVPMKLYKMQKSIDLFI